MSYTASEIGVATESLRKSLENALVRKVISPAAGNRICIELRSPGKNHFLQICLLHPFCAIGRTSKKPSGAEVPVSFVMLLRKWCINRVVAEVRRINDDRVVEISLTGKTDSFRLICELTGRHSNLFLLDGDGKIMGSYYPNRSSKRNLVAPHPYQPPLGPPPVNQKAPRAQIADDADIVLLTLLADAEANAEINRRRIEANRALKSLIKKQKKLVTNLSADSEKAAQAETLKNHAYVLQANLHRIEKGASRFEGTDFEGKPVAFSLNPALSAVENMQVMFEKAGRYGRATERIEDRLLAAMEEQERLEELHREVESATSEQLDMVLQQLEQQHFQTVQRARRRGKVVQRLPYRQFPIFSAHTARVGKSARDNDTLTLRHAGPNDLWLHVRGVPGSHVVVPMGRGEEPSQDVLVDAAHLAVHYSSAKGDDHVEITYTKRKYVQKPRGAAHGSVRLLQEKTFVLKVDRERLEQLLSHGK